MVYKKPLDFFAVSYNQMQSIVPFVVLAPAYFAGQLSLGDLFQLIGALKKVYNSLDWAINVYPHLTLWRATCDRLLAFESRLADARRGAKAIAALGSAGAGK